MIEQRNGLADVMTRYEAVLLDLWGVVHDGIVVHPGALDFIGKCRDAGIKVGLLSNAPRRTDAVAQMLETKFSLPPNGYDLLMTSGEDCWHALNAVDRGFDYYKRPGNRGWLLGTLPLDESMVLGLDIDWVDDPASCDFCLNTGPHGEGPKVSDYEAMMDDWLARGVPMVCANPDRFVHRGDSKQICAGAVAERFEERGGLVRWHGKPHSSVYRRCFAGLGDVAPNKVLMVGDSFITDIKGAVLNGMDSALVTSGLYREEIAALGVEVAAAQHGVIPTYAVPALSW